jgi:hypothetical protein
MQKRGGEENGSEGNIVAEQDIHLIGQTIGILCSDAPGSYTTSLRICRKFSATPQTSGAEGPWGRGAVGDHWAVGASLGSLEDTRRGQEPQVQ